MPADNCREALTDARRAPLVKVETLPGAIDALNNVVAGKAAPSCTR